MHGISWPLSNPKKLIVEYAKKEDMEKARETLKDQPISRKSEQSVSDDMWPQDKWAKEERNNISHKVIAFYHIIIVRVTTNYFLIK